jgi:hypothetical protein
MRTRASNWSTDGTYQRIFEAMLQRKDEVGSLAAVGRLHRRARANTPTPPPRPAQGAPSNDRDSRTRRHDLTLRSRHRVARRTRRLGHHGPDSAIRQE